MRNIENFIRWFVGVLFIFSGLVKLDDPMGTAIKMEEYFEVFSSDISSIFHYLVPHAMAFGLFVIFLEILLGVALLISFKMRVTTWILLLLIVFFSFLTFYSAYFNKVTDCGCFGDAIPLNPWQSFTKDLVLLVLIALLFVRRKSLAPVLSGSTAYILLVISSVFCVAVAYYATVHLPPIDFRPYKVGTDIRAAMQPSEDYKYKYVMEKDGEKFEFSQYPTDTSYKFLEMILLNPEAEPKIIDFNVWNEDGDFTEATFDGVKFLILFSDVKKSDLTKIEEIVSLTSTLKTNADCWIITANDESTFENFRHAYQVPLPYYFADGTVIKAMIRANPGLMLLKNGIVKGKWNSNDLPDKDEIMKLIY